MQGVEDVVEGTSIAGVPLNPGKPTNIVNPLYPPPNTSSEQQPPPPLRDADSHKSGRRPYSSQPSETEVPPSSPPPTAAATPFHGVQVKDLGEDLVADKTARDIADPAKINSKERNFKCVVAPTVFFPHYRKLYVKGVQKILHVLQFHTILQFHLLVVLLTMSEKLCVGCPCCGGAFS